MFFDAFDAIRILNLPHRADRRNEMMRELGRLGLADDPRVSFFPGSMPNEPGCFSSTGVHGCYISHLAALKEAASSGQRVLILEDDCDFTAAANAYRLPQEWDIFYGGYLAETPDDLERSNIIGAHCMGYSRRAAKELAAYLKSLIDPEFEPDGIGAAQPDFDPAIKPPFDGAIVWFRRAHPQFKTEFAQIAVQRSSRSDIAIGNFFDQNFPTAVTAARKLKNWFRRR